MKFKVGDKLRIREWDDMLEEYGENYGGIACMFLFTNEMRDMCGKVFTVKEIIGEHLYSEEEIESADPNLIDSWNISEDMLEYAEDEQEFADVDDSELSLFLFGI